MKNVSIGILELGYRSGKDPLTSIQEIIDYAVMAENLNYSRFWLAEHHNSNIEKPFTNPEILIALIAGMTDLIRVGSAGSLIKMYLPYNIVTTFKLLNNLFSNRIDLGLSKGNPGIDWLRQSLPSDNDLFSAKMKDIANLLTFEQKNYEENEIIIPPFGGEAPQLWYLSNSYNHFNDAIQYKLNYCRSTMHGEGLIEVNYDKEQLVRYKETYLLENGCYPKVSLAIAIVLGNTVEQAEAKYKVMIRKFGSSKHSITPIVVSVNSLFHKLQEYQFLYGVDEFIIYDMEGNNKQKIANLESISQIFKLSNQDEKDTICK